MVRHIPTLAPVACPNVCLLCAEQRTPERPRAERMRPRQAARSTPPVEQPGGLVAQRTVAVGVGHGCVARGVARTIVRGVANREDSGIGVGFIGCRRLGLRSAVALWRVESIAESRAAPMVEASALTGMQPGSVMSTRQPNLGRMPYVDAACEGHSPLPRRSRARPAQHS